jgi:FkbM family methyltransferase
VVRGLQGYLARHNLAVVYTEMGDFARAEAQWRLALAERPHYRPGWHGLGDSLLAQGKLDEAEAVARQLQGDPRLRAWGLVLEGQTAAARGQTARARQLLEQAVSAYPADERALHALCRVLFEQGRPAEAEGPLRRLLALCPRDGSVYHNLGASLMQQARFAEATAAYRASLEHRPGSAPTCLCLGHACWAAGQMAEATHAWSKALRLDPGCREAEQAIRQAQGSNGPQRPPGGSVQVTPYRLTLGQHTWMIPLATRGPVDRAIVRELWQGDAYGVKALAQPPATVVDIGAHIGAFSILAAEAWPGARVIACEADPDNCALLHQNLNGHHNVEAVQAAIVGEDVTEAEFHQVADKAAHNSGGGSCARHEPWTVTTRVAAMSAPRLWREKSLQACDLLKLDCEGCEVPVLRSLAQAGLLAGVRLIVGEWHAPDGSHSAREEVQRQLQALLAPTHEVAFSPEKQGREGRFTARRRAA